jgi:hypothetical protein
LLCGRINIIHISQVVFMITLWYNQKEKNAVRVHAYILV